MCIIVFIDHCETTLIHFIKVTKDFKNKYESLKDQEIYIVHYQKSHPKKTLSFFNRKRKSNSRLVPAYIHCETIVIHLVKVTIKDFKGSVMS